ncbi:MAG: ribose-phosphate pyrophosphokinase [Acidobacteriota bacterium]|nr:MAG: ribose-phosphate pyrophosphokinase [Acidobacteriota bacterium]
MALPEEHELKVFTGNAHPALAREICDYLGETYNEEPCGEAEVKKFSDGETRCQILENVRGRDVFVVQPTSPPANEHLMELLIMIDALKRASAWRITAVLPYYGYARQDRKDKPRVPITAKLVADLISAAGTDRVLSMDLHAAQIQGYFDIPVDHLFAMPVCTEHVRTLNLKDLTVVSPDAGGVERARALAKRVDASLAIIDKRRTGPNEAEALHVVGDVKGRTALILDDIVDTAGTLVNSIEALRKEGAKSVYACITHGVLSGPAIDRLKRSSIETLILTNTIPHKAPVLESKKFVVLSVASLFAEAIMRIHRHTSVNVLFSEKGLEQLED